MNGKSFEAPSETTGKGLYLLLGCQRFDLFSDSTDKNGSETKISQPISSPIAYCIHTCGGES